MSRKPDTRLTVVKTIATGECSVAAKAGFVAVIAARLVVEAESLREQRSEIVELCKK